MSALSRTSVPVPPVRVIGSVDDPLGIPCHITDFIPGYVLGDVDTAIRHLTHEAIRTASIDVVSVLAQLHLIDPEAIGLSDFGPRTNYVERQLHRWASVVSAAKRPETESLAADLEEIATLLEPYLPSQADLRIVHGDYRLGNTLVDDSGAIQAVLDWELATLGDPLADLGLLAAFWRPPARAMLGVEMPTAAPGAIDESEALQRYAHITGADLGGFWFYRAFSAWRLACTAFRARSRYASGAMGDETDASQFVVTCTAWTEIAREALSSRS